MSHRVVIQAFSLGSAEYIKEQVEKHLPFIEGLVTISIEPPITTLDKIIDSTKGNPKVIDARMLRLLVLEEEMDNCFVNITEEAFFRAFNKSRKEGFNDSVAFWNGLDNSLVYNEVITMFGQQYYDDVFAKVTRTIDEVEVDLNNSKLKYLG